MKHISLFGKGQESPNKETNAHGLVPSCKTKAHHSQKIMQLVKPCCHPIFEFDPLFWTKKKPRRTLQSHAKHCSKKSTNGNAQVN
jgi:hypothetical protein